MVLLLLAVLPVRVFSQEATLRRGFREIQLQLPMERVQDLLAADSAFDYRGPADLSMALSREEPVIDTRGRGFVQRGLFQFSREQLYIITLYLDQRHLDYFQLFEQLRQRYGDPVDLDPRRAVWDDAVTRIELERPLTVRYIDLDAFETIRQERRMLRAAQDVSREQFLEEF